MYPSRKIPNKTKQIAKPPNGVNSMKGTARFLFRIGLIVAFACPALWGQATAQISGTVADQSGARLPGAEVSATQTATGLVRTVVSNEDQLECTGVIPHGSNVKLRCSDDSAMRETGPPKPRPRRVVLLPSLNDWRSRRTDDQ
jgi:hypothetical protein